MSYRFAPIYDSGSSLGRELQDERVNQMLQNQDQLEAYIRRGKSEIHWEGVSGKQKHLELVSKISEYGYRNLIVEVITSIKTCYNTEKIIEIMMSAIPLEFI